LSRSIAAVIVAVVLAWGTPAAYGQSAAVGAIEGTLSTQAGTVYLPGVTVVVRDADGRQVAEETSDGTGLIKIGNLAAGAYRVTAALDGFESVERVVTIPPGGTVAVEIDMPIAALSERVDVVAASPVISTSGSLAASETVSNAQTQTLAPGGSVDSALRLIPTVIDTRAGQSIDGGRPDQVGFQIGAATFVEPGTNLSRIRLPTDGIDSVAVLPNPYETEFGRFSSGLVVVQTRRAGDKWKFAANNLVPAFRTKRFTLANVQGIGSFKPSMELGGPLVDSRLFLEQTAQYHYDSTDVPSRPENELKTAHSFGSMTRLDANLSRRHTMAVTAGFEQGEAHQATLGTFTPIEATANTSDQIGYGMVTERSLLSGATYLESTLQLHRYSVGVSGQGTAPMELQPETTLGNFFNRQHRDTSTVQWVETASTSHKGPGGLHLVKVGADVMTSSYHGTSDSAPVLVERSDGSLARRLDYGGPTTQRVHSTDLALFAQDRIQPSPRWYVEVGGRVDRDGIAGNVNASPRVGTAVVLNRAGTAVLRGGYGLFYERTPSVAGAFPGFEAAIDSRFEADGVTPIGRPALVEHVVADLRTAGSSIWDIGYDHRFNPRWALHVSVLDRQGDNQLILNPVNQIETIGTLRTGGTEQLVLSSGGRSSYLQEAVDVHITAGTRVDLITSYVHSRARENLNTFVNFYGSILQPIVGEDQYAPAASDAPNRLFLRGQAMPTARWLLLGSFDVRSGLPYSVVNEDLEFVGPRNERRFPTYVRTELGFDRRVTLAHAHPWLGLRVANALGAFLPTDVQANLASPNFGAFYNSEYREFRIHVRFEK
jgi:carboxypeptidase family protein/TonB-dependent receptor-like protein